MLRFLRRRSPKTSFGSVTTYEVKRASGPGEVNFRSHRLWRPDNRFPGEINVNRHESGGAELSFTPLREGAKPRPAVVVDERDVDKLILSLLEIRSGEWEEVEE